VRMGEVACGWGNFAADERRSTQMEARRLRTGENSRGWRKITADGGVTVADGGKSVRMDARRLRMEFVSTEGSPR